MMLPWLTGTLKYYYFISNTYDKSNVCCEKLTSPSNKHLPFRMTHRGVFQPDVCALQNRYKSLVNHDMFYDVTMLWFEFG